MHEKWINHWLCVFLSFSCVMMTHELQHILTRQIIIEFYVPISAFEKQKRGLLWKPSKYFSFIELHNYILIANNNIWYSELQFETILRIEFLFEWFYDTNFRRHKIQKLFLLFFDHWVEYPGYWQKVLNFTYLSDDDESIKVLRSYTQYVY